MGPAFRRRVGRGKECREDMRKPLSSQRGHGWLLAELVTVCEGSKMIFVEGALTWAQGPRQETKNTSK